MRLKTLVVLVVSAAMLLCVPISASAAQVTITATVDAQLVSITVSQSTVNFGTMGAGDFYMSNPLTVTNTGTIPVKLRAGTDTVDGPGDATWAIRSDGMPPGTDEYAMNLWDATTGGMWLQYNTLYPWPGDPTVAVSANRQFDLRLKLGTTTAYGAYSIPVIVYAYAP